MPGTEHYQADSNGGPAVQGSQDGQTIIPDLIKGRIVFENSVLDSLIILSVQRLCHL
ncbi:MAG: hypothetical protein R3B74_11065 [Nitrospirales bacterium]|nr:hypothetical protein [Nitrospirales bacterium]